MKNRIDIEIKQGVNLHLIKTDKFKTDLLSVFLSTPLQKETVTKNALIPAVLGRGSQSMPTQEAISIALEEMYGASFNCGVDKIGDDQVLKFYLETINNDYLPNDEDNLQKAIHILLEILFNPQKEEGIFKEDYVESEKTKLKQIIEGKKDAKATYALEECIKEMYKDQPYGIYKYGKIEDLDAINAQILYKQYEKLLKECKIDIFISGNIEDIVEQVIRKEEAIQLLPARKPKYIINNREHRKKEKKAEKTKTECMDIAQGKLIIGMDLLEEKEKDTYTALVYNAILGGTPTSKLFQNVREKNSLAYTAASSYIRQKANFFIKCGIEIQNYEKAVEIIKEQIEDMKQGNFTEEDIIQAKTNIISTVKFIPDEQDTELMYYFSQELSGYQMSYEEYIQEIESVTKEKIIELANRVQINTIYFLTKEKEAKN